MYRKAILVVLFWLLILAMLSCFFFFFATYGFKRQEEMQLFISTWDAAWSYLKVPGGFINVLGIWLTQYYTFPLPAAVINAALLCGTGICCYLIFQKQTNRNYHLLLSLFPVVVLLKYHIQSKYVADGTIGWLCMMLALTLIMYLRHRQLRMIAGLTGVIVIFWVAGQLVILYSILWVVLETLLFPFRKPAVSVISASGVLLGGWLAAMYGVRYAFMLPLTDGLFSKAYHDVQLQSDSFIYYAWIRFTLLFIILSGIARLLSSMKREKRVNQYIAAAGIFTGLFLFTGYCLPDRNDVHNRMMYRLEYLSQRRYWDEIIAMHTGKKIPSHSNRNYLNLALAQKGALGNRLFYYDQHGPHGLLAPYDGTVFTGIILSDIHFKIGDLSLSESYAMEVLTGANRGGSPRALQRLIQISLLRQEWELARKYLQILQQTLCYREWANHYASLADHPIMIVSEPELQCKHLPGKENTLLGLLDINAVWTGHLTDSTCNRTAFEYLGCAYLLAKETDLFKDFLLSTAGSPVSLPLPLHFQEAAMMVFAGDTAMLNRLSVEQSVRQKYASFLDLSANPNRPGNNLATLHQQFGNTFWFYYHHKDIEK